MKNAKRFLLTQKGCLGWNRGNSVCSARIGGVFFIIQPASLYNYNLTIFPSE